MTNPRVKMNYKNETKCKNCLLEKRFGLKKAKNNCNSFYNKWKWKIPRNNKDTP